METCLSWVLVWMLGQGEQDRIRSRFRTADPEIAAAVDRGVVGSATFRHVMEAVAAAGAIVYLIRYPALPRGVTAGLAPVVHGTAGTRYLRVLVRPDVRGLRLVTVLAHELQHALELLEASPESPGSAGVRAFQAIGFRTRAQTIETAAARAVEERVARELLLSSRGIPTSVR